VVRDTIIPIPNVVVYHRIDIVGTARSGKTYSADAGSGAY
jgi:hypothetical protein